jgi:hypothetical protein
MGKVQLDRIWVVADWGQRQMLGLHATAFAIWVQFLLDQSMNGTIPLFVVITLKRVLFRCDPLLNLG